jgi:hypothetical protein
MSLDPLDGCPGYPYIEFRARACYKEEGSPNRRVMSLREDLANLACKLCRLVVHVWAWLSS